MSSQKRFLASFAALVLSLTSVASAQMNRASLSGTVTDSSGAVVPETSVVAVQTATQSKFTATANQSGVYNFIGLPIGEFTVSAERQGFSKTVRTNVVLTADSAIRVDLELTPGAIGQQVEVTAAAPLIEERSSAYGVNVQTQALEKLPLQVSGGERSLYSFLNTVPGVSNAGFANNIMGGVGMYSQVVYDGVTAEYNPGVQGVMSHPPSVETIAEFKVVNSVAAEYGLTGGAFMSFISKSGTNQFHGDAFEYLRNNDFDARTFFAPTVSIEKQNEFGVTGGGPVIIPKVYDGRNKTFFFATFTQFIQHTVSQGSVVTLPTAGIPPGRLLAVAGSGDRDRLAGAAGAAGSDLRPEHYASGWPGRFHPRSVPGEHHSTGAAKLGVDEVAVLPAGADGSESDRQQLFGRERAEHHSQPELLLQG